MSQGPKGLAEVEYQQVSGLPTVKSPGEIFNCVEQDWLGIRGSVLDLDQDVVSVKVIHYLTVDNVTVFHRFTDNAGQ